MQQSNSKLEKGLHTCQSPEIDKSSLINDADDDDDASTSAEALPTSPDDEMAYLAYLKSPLAAESSKNDTTGNDTLDSLFTSYSALSSDRSVL